MRRLTPASPTSPRADHCFPVPAPCAPVLISGLPGSWEVSATAVFAHQQAERDMESKVVARDGHTSHAEAAQGGPMPALRPAPRTPFSPKEKRMNILGLSLLTLLLLPLPGWSTALDLFVIQRSKNTNEVQYQLHVNDRCQIVSDHPVDAFWRLREVSPETTAPLTDLEQMAYGVVNQQVAEHGVSFDLGVLDHFRALEQRRITATVRSDPDTATCTSSVQTTINGQVAALERMYVQTDERRVRPKVLYIDVLGRSLASRPTQVSERIEP
jgi:Domain of unknown function (DUF4833)